MKGSATVTPSTGGDANEPGKNDVYLPVNATITIKGNLIPEDGGTAARITVPNDNYQTGTKVLKGSAVSTEYRKFTVTPKNGQDWKVDESGCLKHK